MIKDTVYLNGELLPVHQAVISPLDRGFLFGDGIYEFIPVHDGKAIGRDRHIQRLINGLEAISIQVQFMLRDWQKLIDDLINKNGGGDLGVYIQVSRGADNKRHHAFPKNVKPTVFAMCSVLRKPLDNTGLDDFGCKVVTQMDQRWRNCHVKSTSLLGNVMHFQHGQNKQKDETLLYNEQHMLTEAASCNVFVVDNNHIITPRLDHQILPGITRAMLIDILHDKTDFQVTERDISIDEVRRAQEVWLTSSSREVMPVLQIDDVRIGDGKIGNVCKRALAIFNQYKFDY